MNTRNTLVGALIVVMGLFLLSAPAVMAQPVDYCEGNFDNDYDVDGSDAFVFKTDFGRSSLSDPCPVIECQTAEELEIRIVQLETQLAQVTALLENVTRDTVQGYDTIRFSGVNVQIVDGSGTTEHDVNGLGNLIVGYNEFRDDGTDDRTGSHNLVVGQRHNYSSYGGLVTGYQNNVLGIYATVSGGQNNTASGRHASVSGGARNTASGDHANVAGGRYNEASGDLSFVGGGGSDTEEDGNTAFGNYSVVLGGYDNIAGDPDLLDHTIGRYSSVSGGYRNEASGGYSSVSGGMYNEASGTYAAVSGGNQNTASGHAAGVSGGERNEASGGAASVSGGRWNDATGEYASVAGGRYNEAAGDVSFVGGGGSDTEEDGNTAFGNYSVVLGGYDNIAGDPDLLDHTIGRYSSVSGGLDNKASGLAASISGGLDNKASEQFSSVSGGYFNTASDSCASVSGGFDNEASGYAASVSGGEGGSVTGSYDWRAGNCYFCED